MLLLIITPIVLKLFDDKKEQSIVLVGTIVGNTGNLGIPLGIALFGEDSIIYTSLINLANVFIVFSVGVYLYSRGKFSIKESLLNIFKLPAIWFGIAAIAFNLFGLEIPAPLKEPMKMGAYSAIVLQLMIFGSYLATVKRGDISKKLLFSLVGFKFILTPALLLILSKFITLEPFIFNILLLELIVPMAVMNVNLSALYDCYPQKVAYLTFLTSVIFIIYLMVLIKFIFIL